MISHICVSATTDILPFCDFLNFHCGLFCVCLFLFYFWWCPIITLLMKNVVQKYVL